MQITIRRQLHFALEHFHLFRERERLIHAELRPEIGDRQRRAYTPESVRRLRDPGVQPAKAQAGFTRRDQLQRCGP